VIVVHLDELLTFLLFCGFIILISGSTLVFGLLSIIRHTGVNNKLAVIFYSLLLAAVAFEFTLLGSIFDPRVTIHDWKYILTISTSAGIVTFLVAIAITLLHFLIIGVNK
jgi:hypothetical protein